MMPPLSYYLTLALALLQCFWAVRYKINSSVFFDMSIKSPKKAKKADKSYFSGPVFHPMVVTKTGTEDHPKMCKLSLFRTRKLYNVLPMLQLKM